MWKLVLQQEESAFDGKVHLSLRLVLEASRANFLVTKVTPQPSEYPCKAGESNR